MHNLEVRTGSELHQPVGASAGVALAPLVALHYGLVQRASQQPAQLVVSAVFDLIQVSAYLDRSENRSRGMELYRYLPVPLSSRTELTL